MRRRDHTEEHEDAASIPGPELAAFVDSLQRIPAVRPDAVARVAAAARARTGARAHRPAWPAMLGAAAAAVLVAGALVLHTATRDQGRSGDQAAPALEERTVVGANPTADTSDITGPAPRARSASAVAMAEEGRADAPLPVPFIFRRPGATRVAVAGDFNGWNPSATRLVPSANGVWTATAWLSPGRHAYMFVVDDTLWVRDPRAPAERDADYGRTRSVIVVGVP